MEAESYREWRWSRIGASAASSAIRGRAGFLAVPGGFGPSDRAQPEAEEPPETGRELFVTKP